MQDFDKQIRALLEDAEEKVPSGVWNAVSRGLDRAEAKRIVPVMWWRRAAVAVAAAAAEKMGVTSYSAASSPSSGSTLS